MKKLCFFSCLFLLFSCSTNGEKEKVFPYYYLNAGSAKSWVIQKRVNDKKEKVNPIKGYRKSFIFYSNHSFREQSYIHLGSEYGQVGFYAIKMKKGKHPQLILNYTHQEKVRRFNILKINAKNLWVQPVTNPKVIWKYVSLEPPNISKE